MKIIFEFGDGEVRKFELDEAYGTSEFFKIVYICSKYPHIGKKLRTRRKKDK